MNEYAAGSTSLVEVVDLLDSASTLGAGKTGLAYNTASLTCYYKRSNGSASVAVTLVNITTLGTFVSGGFKEIDATGQPGSYEFHPPDAAFAAGAKWVTFYFVGAAGMVRRAIKCRILAVNPDDAVRGGMTAMPNVASGNAGALLTAGSGTAQLDVTGGVAKANVMQFLGTLLTETVGGYLTAGFKKFFDVPTPVLTTAGVNQTGDSYARLGAPAGASHAADVAAIKADTASLLTRLSAARAGYLDNLNVGGAVASQADINAINQSASRRIILTTVGQYERPESGATVYTVEARTYDGDGAVVNADSTPTLTATGKTSGSLAANLAAASNPATGVYRWNYTVNFNATQEEIRFDISAVIGGSTFPLAVYTQVVDEVAANFSATDRTYLTAVYNKLPVNNIADQTLLAAGQSSLTAAIDAVPTAAENRQEMDSGSTQLQTVVGKLPVNNIADQTLLSNSIANLQAALEAVIASVQESVDDLPDSAAIASELFDTPNTIDAQTLRGYCRIMLAGMVGKVSGANTNAPKFLATNSNKIRIDAETDQYGNRLQVTLDGS